MQVRHFVVVVYDIPNDRVRTKVCNELKNYGDHVQLSVFECVLSEGKYHEMKEALEEIISDNEALVRFYKICQSCVERSEIMGEGVFSHDVDIYVA
ncbi:MAG: CRISPR-associated endonuclease Cas2 [Actinobacteria bacterium]|nr:CRISPR-associated endonuclease Cas2 [Actinomycetota bacterium]